MKPARRAVAGSILLLAATLASGAAASPFLPLLAGALILTLRYVRSPVALAAPACAAVAIAAVDILSGDVRFLTFATPVLLLAAAVPGLLWRRDVQRAAAAHEELESIRAQVVRGRDTEAPTAAEELADLERVVTALGHRLGAHQVILWDVDAYHGRAIARVAHGGRTGTALRLSGDPLGWVWEQAMRMRLDPAPAWAGRGMYVVADCIRRQDEHGIIVTYSWDSDRQPHPDDAFEEAAVYLRAIISLQEAKGRATAAERNQRTLLDGLRSIPGELETGAFAAELCQTAMTLVSGTGAALGTWENGIGTVLAVAGEDGGPRAGDTFEPPASELALAIRAESMLVHTAEDGWTLGSTHVAHDGERWLTRPRALAALPLHGTGGIIGVLAVWTSASRSLDADSLGLLHALAPHAAQHMEHTRTYGLMRDTAARDPLTTLRNRRGFDEVFDREVLRFDRHGRPLTVLALDLDHFKAVNDRYGHDGGDEVLRSVARTLAATIRDVDTAARFGGEEFVVLLPETGIRPAMDVAERIRSAVAASAVTWNGQRVDVSVSIGVASVPETTALPADLLTDADAALYTAKRTGRNRVSIAGATPAGA